MATAARKKPVELFDKPLSSKGKVEVRGKKGLDDVVNLPHYLAG